MGSLLPDRFVPEGVGIEVILAFSARDSYSQRFGPKRFNAFKQNFKKISGPNCSFPLDGGR